MSLEIFSIKNKQADGDEWAGVVSVDPDAIEFALPAAATDSPTGLRLTSFQVTHRRIPVTPVGWSEVGNYVVLGVGVSWICRYHFGWKCKDVSPYPIPRTNPHPTLPHPASPSLHLNLGVLHHPAPPHCLMFTSTPQWSLCAYSSILLLLFVCSCTLRRMNGYNFSFTFASKHTHSQIPSIFCPQKRRCSPLKGFS